jgi:hypothetical protein
MFYSTGPAKTNSRIWMEVTRQVDDAKHNLFAFPRNRLVRFTLQKHFCLNG